MITAWMLYLTISTSNWLIHADDLASIPSSQWLVMKQVEGVFTLEHDEYTTAEIQEFEWERSNEQ